MVLPKHESIPLIVTAGQPSVAVRVPSHPLFRQLLRRAGLPLAAPSANPFGYVSPTTAQHVLQGIGKKIAHILDGGASQIGLESTIVDLRNPTQPTILRPGAITRDQIAHALKCEVGTAAKRTRPTRQGRDGQIAPGLLARHYSPRTPVMLHRVIPATRNPKHAYVFLRRPPGSVATNVFWLDPDGNLRGVARRLFATLRKLDSQRFTKIHVELAPREGLGIAINDRLSRAAAK
jgi:L-threonylcarbamoyladenylate synthase